MNKLQACGILSLLLLLSAVAKTPGLRVEEISTLPKGVSKIRFLSRESGWLLADGRLWSSSDGGRHWTRLERSGLAAELSDFEMLSAVTGWALDSKGRVVRTSDGWKHGMDQCLIPQAIRKGSTRALWFDPSFRSGWISGNASVNAIESVPAIYRTENGGATWEQQRAPDIQSGKTIVLTVVSSRTAVGVTTESVVTTQDAGAHWSTIFIDPQCSQSRLEDVGLAKLVYQPFDDSRPRAVAFAEELHGWISDGRGYLIATQDGGKSWCDVDRDTARIKRNAQRRGTADAMAFTDSKTGYALFDWMVGITHDGGLSWATVKVHDSLEGFVTAGPGYVWAYSSTKLYRLSSR